MTNNRSDRQRVAWRTEYEWAVTTWDADDSQSEYFPTAEDALQYKAALLDADEYQNVALGIRRNVFNDFEVLPFDLQTFSNGEVPEAFLSWTGAVIAKVPQHIHRAYAKALKASS